MTLIRLYTDEDVYGMVAPQLRAAGFDAISTPEANRIGASDESQLSWAAQQSRVLVTFNVSDFARLHQQWISHGQHHEGIIVSQQRPLGETLLRLLNVARTLDSESLKDRIEYLSNWSGR